MVAMLFSLLTALIPLANESVLKWTPQPYEPLQRLTKNDMCATLSQVGHLAGTGHGNISMNSG